jgi:hypothetical protein
VSSYPWGAKNSHKLYENDYQSQTLSLTALCHINAYNFEQEIAVNLRHSCEVKTSNTGIICLQIKIHIYKYVSGGSSK